MAETPTYADVVAAILELEDDNPAHWTEEGKPDSNALSSVLGGDVKAKQRDKVWLEFQPHYRAIKDRFMPSKTKHGPDELRVLFIDSVASMNASHIKGQQEVLSKEYAESLIKSGVAKLVG